MLDNRALKGNAETVELSAKVQHVYNTTVNNLKIAFTSESWSRVLPSRGCWSAGA